MPCKKILVIASFEKTRGTGHFVRGKHLVRGLRDLGCEAYLCVYTAEGRPPSEADLDDCRLWLISKDDILQNWAFIIFDRFSTPPAEFEAAFSLAPLLAIDEGGPLRDAFDFVLDILPNKPSLSRPNVLYCGLLPLPANRRPDFPQAGLLREGRARILVSFGGEDAAQLGGRTAAALRAALPHAEITLIQGASGGATAPDGVTVKMPAAALRETLASFDLLVTHYGLTAYEASYARTAVLLVSPSPIHRTLGREAGFFDAGLGGAGIKRLKRLFKQTAFFEALVRTTRQTAEKYGLDLTQKRTLAEYIYNFDVYAFRTCPVCGKIVHSSRKMAARFPEQTFVVCPHCSMIIQNRTRPPPIDYTEQYFFEMYKEQYGKTYLEDFPNLIATAKDRLRIINMIRKDSSRPGVLPARRPALLDIGCAYGAFLCAAHQEGFSPFGIDTSWEAVSYINKELDIPARTCHFPDDFTLNIFPRNCFDCITMWFVIEHLQDVPTALKRARSLLRPGGIFAFSTPSASGVSARSSLVRFLERSPADHWSVWKPAAVSCLLGRFGFTVKKIRITGRHPERFPLIGRLAKNGSLIYRVLLAVSSLFKLGDTFEVYAVKSGSPL
ncbi:MAG: methyltransferase domain-containing protein [Spirochaetaceae bacterium]|jgi:2-polyprenyl-3-methyl-5-hydroxy-6-metoxy-1,4-benzoquinol methylase|nr:methyltransferase domain-containing protein [Spirochaetaceae bacterium]